MKVVAGRGDARRSAVHQHTAEVIALTSWGLFGRGEAALGSQVLLKSPFFYTRCRKCSMRLIEPFASCRWHYLRVYRMPHSRTEEMADMAEKVLSHERSLACMWRRMPGPLVLRRAHH